MAKHPNQVKPVAVQRRENIEEVNVLLTMAKQFGYELTSDEQASIRQRVYDLMESGLTAIVPEPEANEKGEVVPE